MAANTVLKIRFRRDAIGRQTQCIPHHHAPLPALPTAQSSCKTAHAAPHHEEQRRCGAAKNAMHVFASKCRFQSRACLGLQVRRHACIHVLKHGRQRRLRRALRRLKRSDHLPTRAAHVRHGRPGLSRKKLAMHSRGQWPRAISHARGARQLAGNRASRCWSIAFTKNKPSVPPVKDVATRVPLRGKSCSPACGLPRGSVSCVIPPALVCEPALEAGHRVPRAPRPHLLCRTVPAGAARAQQQG